jgi:hypothetical protein
VRAERLDISFDRLRELVRLWQLHAVVGRDDHGRGEAGEGQIGGGEVVAGQVPATVGERWASGYNAVSARASQAGTPWLLYGSIRALRGSMCA